MSIGTRSCLFCISSFNSFSKFLFDFSFLRALGSLFHFRTKFLMIEFLLHFHLHFFVREKSFVRLWTLISTFPIILNFLRSCMFVCWTKSKGLFNEVFAIWISAGSILFSRSSLWALPYFVRKKRSFMPHLICLFIRQLSRTANFEKILR